MSDIELTVWTKHPNSGKLYREIDYEGLDYKVWEYENKSIYDPVRHHLLAGPEKHRVKNREQALALNMHKHTIRENAAQEAIIAIGQGDVNVGLKKLYKALGITVLDGGKNQVAAIAELTKAAGFAPDPNNKVKVADDKGNLFEGQLEQAMDMFAMRKPKDDDPDDEPPPLPIMSGADDLPPKPTKTVEQALDDEIEE